MLEHNPIVTSGRLSRLACIEKAKKVIKQIQTATITSVLRRTWQMLAAAFTASILLSAAVCLLAPGTLAVSVLTISTIGLSVLLGVEAFQQIRSQLPSPWRNAADHIHANVVEVFAIAALALLYPLGFINFDPKKKEDASQTPILIVHGYLHNRSGGFYLIHRLKSAGCGNVYTVNLGHPCHSIEEYAHVVQAKAKEIAAQTGRDDLIIIGHSMGGLVSSYYATQLAPKGTVRDVITLGSPIQGTKLAPIGIGTCAKQMRYQSEFVKNLNEWVHENNDTRFVNIGTQTDRIIVPHSSAFFSSHKVRKLTIPDLGHAAYLFSDRVADQIIGYLKNITSDRQV
jgi:triacylglycerol lipase